MKSRLILTYSVALRVSYPRIGAARVPWFLFYIEVASDESDRTLTLRPSALNVFLGR